MKFANRKFAIICLATTAWGLPASAAGTLPPVVEVILHNWEQQMKLKPAYDSVETASDGTVTITNLTAAIPAQGTGPAVKLSIGEIELEEISDEGDGLYEIGGAVFSGMKMEISGADGMGFTFDMPESTIEDWYVKDAGANPTPQALMRSAMNVARKMSSGKITVAAMGQTITSDGFQSTWEGDPATGAGTFATTLSNLAIPESAMALIDPSGTMKQLGYASIAFDIAGGGRMDLKGDNLGFDFNFALTGKEMGSVKFTVSASDIPVAVYGELQKAQTSGKEPDFTALMPQIQGITFNGFSLRFEDGSITKKLLPVAAAMQGMDEAAMVANAGAMLQLGLSQLKNQAFTDQVVAAVNAYLKDPKSLTVEVKPASPLKVMDLTALNPADPGAAIDKLGVTVRAND